MVDGHTSNSQQRFLDGVNAWLDGDRQWPGYWLDAPCCLLEHARVVLTCRSFAIDRWPDLFRKPGWRHGRIEGFNARQQVLCLWDVLDSGARPSTENDCPPEDKCRNKMARLVTNYDEVVELLRVPQVLAHLRRLHAEGRLRPFRSRGDLYQQVEQNMLEAAAERLLGTAQHVGCIRQWRRLMAAAAFEMMARRTHYDYAVVGDETVNVQQAAARRCGIDYDFQQWEQLEQVSECTNRQLVEGSTARFFGFKHRGAMEYYCALHLVDNEQPGWVCRAAPEEITAGAPPIRCGDPILAQAAADPNWTWAFRFAIELATAAQPSPTWPRLSETDTRPRRCRTTWPRLSETRIPPSTQSATPSRLGEPHPVVPNPEKTLASLAELFLPRGIDAGQRPTELIYRAWHLFEVDAQVLREMGLSLEQGRQLILPDAAQVVAHYRRRHGADAEIIAALKGDLKPWSRLRWALRRLVGKGIPGIFRAATWRALLRPSFVTCPPDGSPGRFLMGSPEGEGDENEHPQHEFQLQPFQMQTTPVTRAQYRVFDPQWERRYITELSRYSPEDDCPAIFVDWHDAFACAKWLRREYRLPTEREWEYACRAGTTTQYSFGDDEAILGTYAWFWGNARRPQPVGQLRPNGFGLFDMHGNVWEWCSDWCGPYEPALLDEPTGTTDGSFRPDRGGSWGSTAWLCRAAYRSRILPSNRSNGLGFRLAFSSVDQSRGYFNQ